MASTSRPILLFIILLSLTLFACANTCSNHTFPNSQVFSSCVDLPVLQAYFYWNYVPSTKSVQLAYRASQSSSGWVAWAINPVKQGMVGSQALVAFQNSEGSMTAFTTSINNYSPSLQPGTLSFGVSNISATYISDEITIFAVVGPLQNVTGVNHVWQAGPLSNGSPQMHATTGQNIQSMGTIDFAS
ncbi:hypothetical protein K2173_007590 [Erythroxylum novogranatense]|uniref:DOMON domain-containing protein n=1 Tax=Erythroxylum novogranatense TaxID=1862640 RepID=A0AAV8S8W4_9ROSI|nr:hypothetical protein K2173_007590 [Erythroxylum novogranatense]